MKNVVTLAHSQPVRIVFYPLLLALVAYLSTRGIVDSDTADWITAIIAAVLGIGGTEQVHAAVFSPATVVALLGQSRLAPTINIARTASDTDTPAT